MWAEIAAFNIAIGLIAPVAPLNIFIGLNAAFIASAIIVYDHEKRGRGQ
jgi:hypothetical protein